MQWLDELPSGGAWSLVAVFLMIVLGGPQILSKEGASRFWLLGRFREWLRDRKLREIQDTSRLADATVRGHREDRERWMADLQALRAEMQEDRKRFRSEMDAMEQKVEEYWAYIVFVADYSRQLAILAAKHGWDPPPPRLLSFSEWSRKYDD